MSSTLDEFPDHETCSYPNANLDRAPTSNDGVPPTEDARRGTASKESRNVAGSWRNSEFLEMGMIVECESNNTIQSGIPWDADSQPTNLDFSTRYETNTVYGLPNQVSPQFISSESGIYTMGEIPTTDSMNYTDLSGSYTHVDNGNIVNYQLETELMDGVFLTPGMPPGYVIPFDGDITTTGLDLGTYYAMDGSGTVSSTAVITPSYAFSQEQPFEQSLPVSMSYQIQDPTAHNWQSAKILDSVPPSSRIADLLHQPNTKSANSSAVLAIEGTQSLPPNEPNQLKRLAQNEVGLEFSAYDPSVKDCRRKREPQTSCKKQSKGGGQSTTSKAKIPGLAVFRVKREPSSTATPTTNPDSVSMLMGPPTHQYQRLPSKMSVMDNQGSIIVIKDFQAPVKRKALDLFRKEELKKTRMLGVCWACKFTKTRCTWEGTCSTCVKLATFYSQDPLVADLQNLQCIRSSLTEIRFDSQDFKTNRVILEFMRLAMREIDGSTTGFAYSSFGLNRVYGLQSDTELNNYLMDTSPWDLNDPGRTLTRCRNKEFWFSSFILHENSLLQFLEHDRFVKNNRLTNCPITQNLFEDTFYFYSLITLFEKVLYRKFFDADLQTIIPRIIVGVSMYDKRTNTRKLNLQSYVLKPSAASLAEQLALSPERKNIHSGGVTHFRRMANTISYVGALYSRQSPRFGKALGWNIAENSTVVEANILHTLYACESSTLVSEDNELACLAAGRVNLTFKSDMEGNYLFTRGG